MIRFDTVAANADVIGEDTPMAEPERSPGEQRPGEPGRDRSDRGDVQRERDVAPESGAARAGQDINAPAFIKDNDDARPT